MSEYPPPGTPKPEEPKKTSHVPFWVSLFANLLLVGMLIVTSNLWNSKLEQGRYEGQVLILEWLHQWGHGKLVLQDGSAEFTFDEKVEDRMVYIWDRNKYPDARKYPNGMPPISGMSSGGGGYPPP